MENKDVLKTFIKIFGSVFNFITKYLKMGKFQIFKLI